MLPVVYISLEVTIHTIAESTLITLAPAPAATIAAVVLTLKVLCPSPPVPTMSTTKSSSPNSTEAGTALDLNKLAAVVNDSGLLSRREM